MTGTTRIPAAEISGLKGWLIKRFARKTLGQVPSSLGVYWHNQKVLMDMASVGGKVFTSLEREVLADAEAMTATEPTVTDEMVASLLAQLGDAALVELTAVIAFANFTTRPNVALGIESDGFAAACGLRPLAERSTVGS